MTVITMSGKISAKEVVSKLLIDGLVFYMFFLNICLI